MTGPQADVAGRLGATRSMVRGRLLDLVGGGQGAGIARRAILVLSVGVLTAVVRYLIQILFARRGGPVEFGRYSFAFGWTQVLVVPATLGLTLSVLRFVPQYIQEERWDLLNGLIRRSVQVTIVSGVLFAAAAAGVVLLVGGGASQSALLLGMGLILIVGLVNVLRETTRGTHRVVLAYGVGELLPMCLILIIGLAIPLASGGLSAEQMLLATGAGFVLVIGAQWFYLRRSAPRAFAAEVRPAIEMRTWLLLSAPLWLVTMSTLLINQSDLLTLGLFRSAQEVGIYAAGSKTAFIVSFVLTAVSAVLAPLFVRHHTAGDMVALRGSMRLGMRLITWPSLAIAGVLILWPNLILGAFGPQYESADTVVRILAAGQLVNAITGPAAYLLLLTGAQRTVATVYGISALADIALLLAVTPHFGINGAATVTATTIVISNGLLYLLALRQMRQGEASHGH